MPGKKEKLPLSVTHPELAREADGWDPRKFTPGSNKIVKWKCPINHSYSCAIAKRTYRSDGCPFCSNRRLLVGFNDFASKFPNLANEAFGWDPTETKFNESKQLREWKCKYGHIWQASTRARSTGGGCHVCQGDLILKGTNDLATTHPTLVSEAFNWDPTEFSSGSDAKKEWKCSFGHIWTASIASRVRGSGCSYCKKKLINLGVTDLATKFPSIALEAFGWDPKYVFPSSNKKMNWKCPIGHIYEDTPGHRTGRLTGCPYCSSHKVLMGFNDLKTTNPELAKEASGWDPTTVTSGSSLKRQWKCEQGHTWIAVISSRKINGCPSCSKYGFNPNIDGYFYFIEHPEWQMYQVGITNYLEDRFRVHEKLGWKILEYRGPMDGHLAQQWETEILRMLKAKGADLSNEEIAGKFDGYSEAWSKSTFEVKSIKELMRLTEEFEESKDSASAKSPRPKKSI